MVLPEEGHLLRIFIGESDRHDGMPLYEWIVKMARQNNLAGATVIRGIEGYGTEWPVGSDARYGSAAFSYSL